jgi:hypothetical protein
MRQILLIVRKLRHGPFSLKLHCPSKFQDYLQAFLSQLEQKNLNYVYRLESAPSCNFNLLYHEIFTLFFYQTTSPSPVIQS